MANRTPLTESELERAALVKRAVDLVGARSAAIQLDISERTVFALAAGKRRCSDSLLADVRKMLIAHRQQTGDAIQAIREHERLALVSDVRVGKYEHNHAVAALKLTLLARDLDQ